MKAIKSGSYYNFGPPYFLYGVKHGNWHANYDTKYTYTTFTYKIPWKTKH